MEEKQLNFNQPLLSVRRFSSKVASETDNKRKTSDNSFARLPPLPPYKSELKSGPVRNVGAIPFVWEKTPGRPKDESKLQAHAIENLPITPNLPPGRVSKTKQQDSDTVLKGASESTVSNSQSVATLDEKVTKHQGSKEGIEEKESSDSDDDGDETFLDALDTLSRTESFFTSCSMSGWDDQEVSSDEQARDFMIDRFLPAAKAMTSETPQYVSKKKPLVEQGQQKQMKKVVGTERSPPLNQHRPKSLRHCIQDIGREGSEDENDDSENYTTTACGLFPRLCLLNPIQGLRMEDKVQSNAGISTASHIETTKEHVRPSYNGKKSVGSKSSCESPVEKTLYVDSIYKVKSQTNHKGDSGIYENLSIDSSLENNQHLDVINVKAALQAKISESLDSPFRVCSKNSSILIQNSEFDVKCIDQECTLASSKVEDDGKIDLESQCVMKLGLQELSDATSFFEIPLVLPSLKAPSESWLKRTLPTISSRNISSRPNLAAKWETIVKSSNVHHGHLHEEILNPIAED